VLLFSTQPAIDRHAQFDSHIDGSGGLPPIPIWWRYREHNYCSYEYAQSREHAIRYWQSRLESTPSKVLFRFSPVPFIVV
jgi:hypothetical protein